MKYSEEIVTDDNFDDIMEKLAETIGTPHTNYNEFLDSLPCGFVEQEHDLGFSEFVNSKTVHSIASDCRQACQIGIVAYEVGNGFITFNFNNVL